eukprot:TRINITY_DN12222_c0_g1_i3.p2 TRINITY_DN12222_c0_g1~~TRINITY_DN12222_c0_g1_i3.p2  ORF type:complete len:205 (+),score=17.41 TRINITY_DN12222_c0_g1_i3:149-763(+)
MAQKLLKAILGTKQSISIQTKSTQIFDLLAEKRISLIPSVTDVKIHCAGPYYIEDLATGSLCGMINSLNNLQRLEYSICRCSRLNLFLLPSAISYLKELYINFYDVWGFQKLMLSKIFKLVAEAPRLTKFHLKLEQLKWIKDEGLVVVPFCERIQELRLVFKNLYLAESTVIGISNSIAKSRTLTRLQFSLILPLVGSFHIQVS